MSKPLKPKRGTTAENDAYIGEAYEVTYDTDKNTIVCRDGKTAGGFPLAKSTELEAFKTTQAAKDAAQDEAIAEAKSSADEKALSFEVDGLDLVVTYGNGTTERVKLPTGKGVGDLWWGHDPKSVPANVQLYSGQLLSRAAYEAHSALVLGGKRTVVSESEWQSYAGAHDGMCPYYSSGDGSTTYRMPCIKGVHPQFVAALAEAGQYVEAGAPEIYGSLGLRVSSLIEHKGAFGGSKRNEYSSGWASGTGFKGAIFGQTEINFYASRSSPVYGNSDTIQPPALTFLLGEYVVGSVAVVGEADAESLLASVTTLESNVGAMQSGAGFTEAGKAEIVGWGMPDYSAMVHKAWNTLHTAECNGWVYIFAQIVANQTASFTLEIDGHKVVHDSVEWNTTLSSGHLVPIRKGSTYKGYNGTNNQTLILFPCKGVA